MPTLAPPGRLGGNRQAGGRAGEWGQQVGLARVATRSAARAWARFARQGRRGSAQNQVKQFHNEAVGRRKRLY